MKRVLNWLPKNTAAVICTSHNRRYLTTFSSSLGYLFVSGEKATLIIDGRYFLAAKKTVKNTEVILLENLSEQLQELLKKSGAERVLTENTITVGELADLKEKLGDIDVLPNEGLSEFLDELRSVKSDYEIECIEKAQRIAERAFSETLNFIKPDVNEREIAARLEYSMKLLGSEKESFDTIVVSGNKSAMPHGVPDGNLIKKGDFVTMDFGATYNGYHSDMTRTVAVGFATDKMHEVYQTVLKANLEAEKAVKAGVKCSEVDRVARDVIEQKGYGKYFTHSLGHSVGLLIHESPSLSPKSQAVLKAGNVITDEPGIYIDNEFGVRIEDMLVVTENGSKNLTLAEKSLIIL